MRKKLSYIIIAMMTIMIVFTSCGGEDIQIQEPEGVEITTTTYEDDALTMDVPEGWSVETYGTLAGYSIRAYDPNKPSRQIFFYGKLEPLCKSEAAHTFLKNYQEFTGGAYDSVVTGNAPVLASGVATDIFKIFDRLTTFVETIGPQYSNYKFPVMKDFKEIEKLKYQTPMKNVAKNEGCVRATFTASDGTYSEGIFSATLSDVGTYYMNGVDVFPYSIYSACGVSADAESFLQIQDKLLKSFSSIKFKDSYVKNTVATINAQTDSILSSMSSMSATMDSYNSAWSNRQTTMDSIAEKRSDSILGYDRVYDSETGQTYKAEVGWYDSYNTNRDDYSNQNIYAVDDDSMYNQAVDGYITMP